MTITLAVQALTQGEVVAFPTDTVYGLGCDSASADAVTRLYSLKRRPPDKALPLLVLRDWLPGMGLQLSDSARRAINAFWPGPLTLVLPIDAPDSVPTVAVREPNHPVALELLRAWGHPLASSSANLSGRGECLSAEEVLRQLPELAGRVLPGGPPPSGAASTILDLASDPWRLLREGTLSEARIGAALETADD
ncbi:MAG TPA: L-threonylcarbamoyladenylate synthase [Armatimonadota bacterium]|jgi:L-threonylcarbamoyladenylate synthase